MTLVGALLGAVPAADAASGTAPLQVPRQGLAQIVDTRTWTTGGGNTFPGADVPFGMTQWSPDTAPAESKSSWGGGYAYGDTALDGYSLTHVSGPGCAIAGDVPILPMTGALPGGDPNDATTAFTHTGEVAQAGYYSAASNGPDAITTQLTATLHSAMGQFTFPPTTSADFLIKLQGSQAGDFADTAQVIGNNEVSGSVTSGHFCGRTDNGGQVQEYTVYFDIVFDQQFTASQIVTESGQSDPAAVFLTFDATANPVIMAKVGVSYVSTANAKRNWSTENAGWNFNSVKSAAQRSWNDVLGRIAVSGGSDTQTQEFYSLLYKDFLEPSVASDVNGQYLGADGNVHRTSPGQHDQYGVFSGWDIYHSLTQLQTMIDPSATSDQAQSLINYYAQNGDLQRWGYMNLDTDVMVGDPADAIIADAYAFGGRHFDTHQALADMLEQANTVNNIRPGEALEQQLGYLPADGTYQCPSCNKTERSWVASLLEYDIADFALSQFAGALGDTTDAKALQKRANNWENVFNPVNGLLTPRNLDGTFVSGITGTSSAQYVEGSAYEYLWDVPNNYSALFSLLGGKSAVAPALEQFLSQPNGGGMFAELGNEFSLGEQNAPDYAGDPAATQQAVNTLRNTVYLPGPAGLNDNDDLGANSSAFIWSMLGMYPQNAGTDTLVFASPGFPHVVVSLPDGNQITMNAPNASAADYYVKSLDINGRAYSKLYVPYASLAHGATLDWTMSSTPTNWGSAPEDAPLSYSAGLRSAVGYVDSPQALVTPGDSTTIGVGAHDATGRGEAVQVSVSAPAGLSPAPDSGSITVPANGAGQLAVTLSAASDLALGRYPVTVNFSVAGQSIGQATVSVLVDTPGNLSPVFNDIGITDDASPTAGDMDGNGNTYSAQALAALGITPGNPITAGGVTFTWPDVPAGTPDNVITQGQTVPVSGSGTTLGFLGTGINGAFTGTGTLTYTDGTTQPFTISFANWTSATPPAGDVLVAKTTYLNTPTGQLSRARYLSAAFVSLDSGKTVRSVQLPSVGTGKSGIHVFAVAVG